MDAKDKVKRVEDKYWNNKIRNQNDEQSGKQYTEDAAKDKVTPRNNARVNSQ